MTRVRLGRIFWIGAAAILIAAALVALVAVLRGDFSDTDGRILGTLAALLYTGGGVLAGLALVERRRAVWLGWTVVAGSPVALVLLLRAVWEWVGDGEGEVLWELAWSAVIVLAAAIMASTALLLARRVALVRLAWTTGALAATAAVLTIVAIWDEDPGDALAKVLAAFWILALLSYFLVPVLERFLAPTGETGERVLAQLDDVELVATRAREGTEVHLAPGERVVLRRRTDRSHG